MCGNFEYVLIKYPVMVLGATADNSVTESQEKNPADNSCDDEVVRSQENVRTHWCPSSGLR